MWVVICLFPFMQQYYAYMYLALGLNTGKPDCLSLRVFAKKILIGSVDVFSMAMISSTFWKAMWKWNPLDHVLKLAI